MRAPILLRYADLSYLEDDRPVRKRNEYFAAAGALPPLRREVADALAAAGPTGAREMIERAVAEGDWR